ncbi:MAG: hypothetical protein KVP17_004306, partial [Porospora cf. gigantea B]|uniref:uncharacterized protein n=1 Tax=Porospora cf. gigantea B TaxID=2853592 RepID=UPI003571B54D
STETFSTESTETFSTESTETFSTESTETVSTDATSTEESTETFSTESTETFSTESTETVSTDATSTEESTETFSTESTETFTTESTETFSTESTETFSTESTETDATSTEDNTDTIAPPVTLGNVLISEYVVGSSPSTIAVEVSNYSTFPVHLSDYSLRVFLDATMERSDEPDRRVDFGDLVLPSMESVTVLQPGWSFPKPAVSQEALLDFNGDDAIALFHQENVMDRLGQLGATDFWGDSLTLRRKINDTTGDTELSEPFNADAHWTRFDEDTVDGLGCTGGVCELPTPDATSTEESTETFSTESTETFSTESTETFSTESTETVTTEESTQTSPESALLLSEYVEGSTPVRRAIEVSNYGSSHHSLEGYVVQVKLDDVNSVEVPLSGSLPPMTSYTLLQTGFDLLRPKERFVEVDLGFDGSADLIGLFRDTDLVDSIGGKASLRTTWGRDVTLRRKPGSRQADTDWLDVFDRNDQWIVYPIDEVSGLGCLESDCMNPVPVKGNVLISQVVAGSTEKRNAVEITNYSGGPLSLRDYQLQTHLDGSSAPVSTVYLGDYGSKSVLEVGESFTVLEDLWDLEVPQYDSVVNHRLGFDGHGDLIKLSHIASTAGVGARQERVVDSVGSTNANESWGEKRTFVRKDGNLTADTNVNDASQLLDRYDERGVDDIGGLGCDGSYCEQDPVSPGGLTVGAIVGIVLAILLLLLLLLLLFCCRRRRRNKQTSAESSLSSLMTTTSVSVEGQALVAVTEGADATPIPPMEEAASPAVHVPVTAEIPKLGRRPPLPYPHYEAPYYVKFEF